MEWIDSHCHLQFFQRKGELEAVIARAREAGLSRMIAVGTSPGDWVPYRELAQAYPDLIGYTVGLHPGSVDADWEEAVQQIAPFFMPPQAPLALGEIGLDFFHLPKDPVEAGEAILRQEAAFRLQLSLADELACPVVIHSRNAFAETVRCIDESAVDWARVVFHCFSYGPAEVRQINERGGRASFTGIVTYKNAPEVREAVRAQGLERLMVETDSPYLAPEPHRGQTNEPAWVVETGKRCAEALAVPVGELAARTSANAREFFGI